MNTELYIYEEKKQARLEGMQEGIAQGMECGMAKGMERGRSEGARLANEETARRLKEMNLSATDISKATGLTEEEIRELQ